MSQAILVWLEFAVCAALIALAGWRLSLYGDVIVGLLYRPSGRVFRTVGWISVLLLLVYVLNAYVLFRFGG